MRSVAKRLVRIAALYAGLPLFVGMFLGSGAPGGRVSADTGDANNPIVVENARTGNSDWDLPGTTPSSGDPTIQGFATDISVNVGNTIDFKIKTDSFVYHIDIYRLGYYQGLGARKVASIGPNPTVTLPQAQPDCQTDSATGLVDCGNWSVSASWMVPSDAVSGVYVAKLTRSDGSLGSSHIPFVVRQDARTADVLFQTSDTTWQAYNQYPGLDNGGASLYCGSNALSNAGTEYACDHRAAKVSYNRPFDTRDHDARSFLFSSEQAMIVWLEQNGYDVKYWSGIDTDRRGAALVDAHGNPTVKVFLSAGHDEYWSAAQRANVEHARNAGVNLAFFSGNEMYWKTRWESSIAGTATDYRTLVSYKETMANGVGGIIDPTAVWTGTWRDPRFSPPKDGGRPENAVSGQLWTVNCCGIPLEVPQADGKMRSWRDTDIANLGTNATATLAGGAEIVGYEWDEDVDNGSRPAGIVRMSTTTRPVSQKIADYGILFPAGTATHHLTLYRHKSGALVFGAGTIRWSWGLSTFHDESGALPDQRMEQATVNVLADMNVFAGSLQADHLTAESKSTDFDPPTSLVTSPASSASLPSGTPVTVTGTATDYGGGRVGGVEVSVDGGITWHPATGRESWSYTFTPGTMGPTVIWSRAVDDSGNIEAGTTEVDANGNPLPPTKNATTTAASVTITEPICPCNVWPDAPTPNTPTAADFSAVEVGVQFKADINGYVTGLRFYKGADNIGTHIGHLWTASGTLLSEIKFTGESASGWQEITLPWPVAIQGGSTYVASYHTTSGYAADHDYFAIAGHDNGVFHALQDTASSHDGVFRYDKDDAPLVPNHFPTDSYQSSNYWVDIVFNTTPAGDVTPPVITALTATPNGDGSATFSWTTAEPSTSAVLYGTTSGTLTGNAGSATPVSQHVVTVSGLATNKTYYYEVRSTDAAGNSATTAEDHFVIPQPAFRDTTVADFSLGALAGGAKVASLGDGAVIMPVYKGLSGSNLPVGWSSCLWSSSGCGTVGAGSAQVTNGVLTVDGARADTNLFASTPSGGDRTAEFDATFGGNASQHIGFGKTFEDAPWAIFSTNGGGALYARTNNGAGSSKEDVIPVPVPSSFTSWFDGPHHFKIDWSPTTIVYSIDGDVKAIHNVAIADAMQPIVASDYTAGDSAVVVSSFLVGPLPDPYSVAGSFESRVFDAGASVTFGAFSWTGTAAAPTTTLALSYRVGNTPTLTGDWTPVAASGTPIGQRARYIQYHADFRTSDPSATPVLNDVTIEFAVPAPNHAPVANGDAYSTSQNSTLTVAAPGVLANDTDADGDPLTAKLVAPTSNGSVVLSQDGSFAYAPNAGFSGSDSFTYLANDGMSDSPSPATVTISVVKADQTITFAPLGSKTYGDAPFAVNATTSSGLAATFSIVSGPATVSGATVTITGAGAVTVRASQVGDANYNAAPNVDRTFTVNKAAPTITWSNPADITYGTALGATQLNATASVPGTFTYTPAAGTTLSAGSGQTLSVSFAPTDASNYTTATLSVSINVLKATASVTPNAASKTYGGADPAFTGTLSGFLASDNVTASYARPAGETVAASPYTISATLSPAGVLGNYTITYNTAAFTITKAAATVTAGGGTKVYGTADPALSATTATGFTATDAPTITLSSTRAAGETVASYATTATAAGAVLSNYTVTYMPGTFTITKATATVTAGGGTKVYGTADPALSATTQTGFTAADALTITLSSTRAAGETVASYATTATATGAALSNYTVTYVAGTFSITKATPTITWGNPADITYGMALSGTQLNATATTAGAFVYNPAFGSVLNGGNGQTLYVSFTPTDTTNYNSANKSVTMNVLKATPTVTWNNPSDITEGTALSSTQLNATATVAGSFAYSPVSGTALNVGNNQTLSVTFTPTATSNYTTATKTASINVLNVAPVAGPITWNAAVDSGITINTAVIASASFTDPGAADTHTATINWGDTSTSAASVTETGGNGSVSGTHTYTATGLYTAVLTVTDNHGGVGQSSYRYVVVVNPTGGSEAGSGSFASPAGAYVQTPTLAGTGTITSLNAKYATDGTMNLSTNKFQFSYTPASMSLASTKMLWLVMKSGKSWLKGEGTLTIGSTPQTVQYLLSVVDSTSVADKVRVKIWNKTTGTVIYDDQLPLGQPDDAAATLAVSTGPGTVVFMP